jgi:hypothetical protein
MKNRNGSYKKILLETHVLRDHGDYLRENLKCLLDLSLSATDFTTLYMLLFLRIKHPQNWLQKKALTNEERLGSNLLSIIPKSFQLTIWELEKLRDITTYDLFFQFNLKGIPLSINRTMINWYENKWSIEMLHRIPSSKELLALQVNNTRCITVVTESKKIDELVFGTRDPLSFVLHDLMHADQFFSQANSQKGQLGFYRLLYANYDRPLLKNLLKSDTEFKKEFEYVASDMNAYVIHLFKCLKSSIYRTSSNAEFFSELLNWWGMNAEEKLASYHLNTTEFSSSDELILKRFFENNQEIIQ